MAVLRIDMLSLFPGMLAGVLESSILGRAARGGLVTYHLHDIRKWTADSRGTVDDRPFGGGPGMVMMCQPIYEAVTDVEAQDARPAARVLLTPQGRRIDQAIVEELAARPRLLLIAGHYEGVDERVIEELRPLELSVGDFVVSGGELPALLLVDAVVRQVPGVLGHEAAAAQDTFCPRGPRRERLLEGPQYTRPRIWKGRAAPEVLLSGDHEAVARWRMHMMLERTRERRPDLLEGKPSQP